jgi:hypothetical protein
MLTWEGAAGCFQSGARTHTLRQAATSRPCPRPTAPTKPAPPARLDRHDGLKLHQPRPAARHRRRGRRDGASRAGAARRRRQQCADAGGDPDVEKVAGAAHADEAHRHIPAQVIAALGRGRDVEERRRRWQLLAVVIEGAPQPLLARPEVAALAPAPSKASPRPHRRPGLRRCTTPGTARPPAPPPPAATGPWRARRRPCPTSAGPLGR